MRIGALGAQDGALFHPEAVLLVDGDELQVCEGDRFFEQGMCADDDLDLAAGQAAADLFLLACGSIAHQQADLPGSEQAVLACQDIDEIAVMLFGQDGGGRHDGGLRPGLVDHGSRQSRHHGLAGADIALQQAVHRLAGFQVEADLVQGFFLGIGQGEGQGGETRFQPGILHFEDAPGYGLPVTPLAQDTRLQEEDLVESQALAGGLEFLGRVGEMRLEQGCAQVGQVRRPAGWSRAGGRSAWEPSR